jgi:hypothetical protein
MLIRSIEYAALVDPARPQLIGGRFIRSGLDQVTIDNHLSYDALIADLFGLRGSIQWPGGECRRRQQRRRSDRYNADFPEHRFLLRSVHFR